MRKVLLTIMLVGMLYEPAFAYIRDRVFIAETTTDKNSVEALSLMKEVALSIKDMLLKKYPCLQAVTRGEVIKGLDDLRKKALLGPKGEQWVKDAKAGDPDAESYTTGYEEEKRFQDAIDKDLQALADKTAAKYLVHLEIQNPGKNLWGISIAGMNTKNVETYYRDYQVFNSYGAALNSARAMAEKLVKGVAEQLSLQKGGYGEICPFTGQVAVYREVKRDRNVKTNQYYYCNASDQNGHTLDRYTYDVREVWQLDRFGNPDTRGDVAATFLEETLNEEVNRCYDCGPDGVGMRIWNRSVTSNGAANGLSVKSRGDSVNKDATIRLHFNKDSTYTVTVKAASEVGKRTKTVKEEATGLCNSGNKSEPPTTEPLKLGFEYTFGPFTGTPYDTKLAEQKELKLESDIGVDTKEVTILRIDFTLERPGEK